MKPSIRKQDGRWQLTRPGYGFSAGPTTTEHDSWQEAKQALIGQAVGTAGASIERAGSQWVPGLRSHRGTQSGRPRWIDLREDA